MVKFKIVQSDQVDLKRQNVPSDRFSVWFVVSFKKSGNMTSHSDVERSHQITYIYNKIKYFFPRAQILQIDFRNIFLFSKNF